MSLFSYKAAKGPVFAFLLMSALSITGCGYEPLYGQQTNAESVPGLSTVKIDLISDRSGQILRNYLLDRINPRGEPDVPEYRLSVELKESRQNLALRRDETATRANLVVSANYSLVKVGVDEPVLTAKSRSTNSFNIVKSQYATLTSENDARSRAVRELSDQIALRLKIYFKGQGSSS